MLSTLVVALQMNPLSHLCKLQLCAPAESIIKHETKLPGKQKQNCLCTSYFIRKHATLAT